MSRKKILLGSFLCTSIGIGFFLFLQARKSVIWFQPQLFSQTTPELVADHTPQSAQKKRIVYGYVPYWTKSKVTYHSVLTHASFFSLAIQADGKLLDIPQNARDSGYRAYDRGALQEMRNALEASQKLELTITMMDQTTIPQFLQNEDSIKTFLTDLESIIQSQPISGINIDIEYNGLVDPTLQENFTDLLRKTKVVLKKQSPPLSLSIATYADAGDLQRLTHLTSVEPEVDFIVMMAYDYHRSKSPNAGPNSPMYGKSLGKWEEDIMSNLHQYTQVVPSEKIILGVPFYGYAWSVEDGANPNSFTLPKSGESVPYANIQKIAPRAGVERHWDSDALSPYLSYVIDGKTKILYYDDSESMRYKMQLVEQANLGGIAIWALGYEEDHRELWDTIQEFILF